MALSFPYTLSFFGNTLRIKEVVFDIQRFDTISGTGDSSFWPTELADPLWKATISLAPIRAAVARQLEAKIHKLRGSFNTFFISDPRNPYPQADPLGSAIVGSTVLVNSINAERNGLSLKGLPVGYTLTIGDYGQITSAGGKNYFFEISETVVANGSGVTAEFEVFPPIPAVVDVDDDCNLEQPACKMFLIPDGHDPGSASVNQFQDGISLQMMERRR